MTNKNKMLVALAMNKKVRIYIADTTAMVEEARYLHNMMPTSLAALGRVLSMTAVMGSMLKGEGEKITVNINGKGPIGTIMAVAKGSGEVKGFVSDPSIYVTYPDSHKLAVGPSVGTDGTLTVIKQLNLKENFSSSTALQTGEIGDDFAYYFAMSEQRATIVSLGVLVNRDLSCKKAGVFFIELLPGYEESDIVALEQIAANLKPITKLLEEKKSLEEILAEYFTDTVILEEKNLTYHCDCSRQRFKEGLLTLNKKELSELSKDEDIEIICDFCSKEYHFSGAEIKELYEKNK